MASDALQKRGLALKFMKVKACLKAKRMKQLESMGVKLKYNYEQCTLKEMSLF